MCIIQSDQPPPPGTYHVILGHPALAKFMAVPHYAYLKMKLPGTKGIITVSGDYRRSIACATAGSKIAESFAIAEEFQEIEHAVKMEEPKMPAVKRPSGESQFQASKDSKKIPLDASKPNEKLIMIGCNLNNK